MSSEQRRFYIWIFIGGVLIGTLAGQWRKGLTIETDLLHLLPHTEQDAVVSHALDRFTQQLVQRHLFLIEHATFAGAVQAAAATRDAIVQQPFFSEVTGQMQREQERAFYELYFPHRLQLLSSKDIASLQQDQGASLTRKAQQMLYSPMSSAVGNILDADPLLSFPHFLQSLPEPPGALAIKEGWLHGEKEGKHFILMSAVSNETIFSAARQNLVRFIEAWQQQVTHQFPDSNLYVFGMSRYTDRGEQQARQETSLIGGFSIAGVILLFLFVFRSPVPMVVGLLPIAFGLLSALALSFAVFGSIHAITLGFGASLIGVCIDYTFHYYCDLWTHPPSEGGPLRHIFPAISFGAITSLLGYCALFVAPFPGLRQMAFFSTAGLIGAYATVCLAFPFLLRNQPNGAFHLTKAITWLALWRRLADQHWLQVAFGVLLLLACIGIFKLQPNDDVRALQAPPEDLRREEARIRDVAGNLDASRFLLVEGESEDQLLEHLATTQQLLTDQKQRQTLAFFQSLAPFLPPVSQQRAAWQALQAAWQQPNGPLKTYFADMGFEEKAQLDFEQQLRQFDPLTVAEWREHPASEGLRYLWIGETERGFATMVVLGGIANAEALTALEAQHPFLTYIDKVEDISSLMQRYRVIAVELIVIAYAIIFLLCCWRYGWRQAFGVILPPIFAAILVLGSFGLAGYAYSLFHILAMLLVMGIGIDYTIFFAEAGKPKPTTMLAITLSAITTILSFGLLGLSATALLSGFGITVWLGILWAFLLAPMAAKRVAT